MQRGAFILFEGLDRCGKSTQAQKLVEFLNKSSPNQAVLMRFPNRETQSGQLINSYLTNKEMGRRVLFCTLISTHFSERSKIYSILKSGKHIVMDRYAFSGVAYSAAKGLNFKWCKSPDIGLPAPDVIIYLNLSVEEAIKRGQYGEERYESLEFQKKVKKQYEEKLMDSTWKVLDASKSVDELQKDIQSIVSDTIAQCANAPIKKLWEKDLDNENNNQ